MSTSDEIKAALKALTAAAYHVLTESNGVSDNEWRVEDGVAVPEWPVDSFYKALRELEEAWVKASKLVYPANWKGNLYEGSD